MNSTIGKYTTLLHILYFFWRYIDFDFTCGFNICWVLFMNNVKLIYFEHTAMVLQIYLLFSHIYLYLYIYIKSSILSLPVISNFTYFVPFNRCNHNLWINFTSIFKYNGFRPFISLPDYFLIYLWFFFWYLLPSWIYMVSMVTFLYSFSDLFVDYHDEFTHAIFNMFSTILH